MDVWPSVLRYSVSALKSPFGNDGETEEEKKEEKEEEKKKKEEKKKNPQNRDMLYKMGHIMKPLESNQGSIRRGNHYISCYSI